MDKMTELDHRLEERFRRLRELIDGPEDQPPETRDVSLDTTQLMSAPQPSMQRRSANQSRVGQFGAGWSERFQRRLLHLRSAILGDDDDGSAP